MGLFGLGLAFQLVSAISSLEIPRQIFWYKVLSVTVGADIITYCTWEIKENGKDLLRFKIEFK